MTSESAVTWVAPLAATAVLIAVALAIAVAWWLARSNRRPSFTAALATVGTAAVALLLVGGMALATVSGPVASIAAVTTVGVAGLTLAGFPLFIGRGLVARRTGLAPDDALRYATLGWPVALAAAFVGFSLPGTGYANAIALPGVVAVAVLAALFLVVTFGPAVAGVGWYRLWQ